MQVIKDVVIEVLNFWDRINYWKQKAKFCEVPWKKIANKKKRGKRPALTLDLDFIVDLGFIKPSLQELCGGFDSIVNIVQERKRKTRVAPEDPSQDAVELESIPGRRDSADSSDTRRGSDESDSGYVADSSASESDEGSGSGLASESDESRDSASRDSADSDARRGSDESDSGYDADRSASESDEESDSGYVADRSESDGSDSTESDSGTAAELLASESDEELPQWSPAWVDISSKEEELAAIRQNMQDVGSEDNQNYFRPNGRNEENTRAEVGKFIKKELNEGDLTLEDVEWNDDEGIELTPQDARRLSARSELFHSPSRRSLITKTKDSFGGSIPVIPKIELPCIPISPPALMFCPSIDAGINIGVDLDPQFEDSAVGLTIKPGISMDITFAVSLRIGIPILYAQLSFGVTVSVVIIDFPLNFMLDIQKFGLYGDFGMDFKVLQLRIFLEFQICGGFSIFTFCLVDVTLWSFEITAYQKYIEFVRWGMASKSNSRRRLSVDEESELITQFRVYWAFMDNDEYTYYWDKEDFNQFFEFETWDLDLLQVSECGPFVPENIEITEIAYMNST